MKIRRRSIKAGYAADDILWVLDGDDNTWKTWGSAGPKKKSMSKEELIDALNAEGNNYIDVLITKNGENPDDYGYSERIKVKFVKSGCTKKPVKSAKSIMTETDITNLKILTSGRAYVEVYEDSYEQGEGEFSEDWDFTIDTSFDNAQELIDDISDSVGIFTKNLSDYVFLDGSLQTDATVNEYNELPTDEELEAWTRGEIKLYVAHLWVDLEVGSGSHEMTDDEAEAFGFSLY